MEKLVLLLALVAFAPLANAANILFMFSGASQPVSTTLVNPYSLAAVPINGTYLVNDTTYVGNASDFNTLLMTNTTDMLILDLAGVPQMINMHRIVAGNGSDVVNLASSTITTADTLIFGGTGNQLIWANSGNDTISPGLGYALIDGGPGTDTIAFVSNPLSAYTITGTGPGSYHIAANNSSVSVDISAIEFGQFSDQTVELSTLPEPTPMTELCLIGSCVGLLWTRRRLS